MFLASKLVLWVLALALVDFCLFDNRKNILKEAQIRRHILNKIIIKFCLFLVWKVFPLFIFFSAFSLPASFSIDPLCSSIRNCRILVHGQFLIQMDIIQRDT
ncbi:MAG: hypothetical protein EXX96DRAFT_291892 [Benjaminiella poitrasii]|nr:MAG: hypothetical protein EXX96DRAFT_291892 [Benjaminiella poitrasii]